MIDVVVNGERRQVAAGSTVADVVRALSVSPDGRGVAVAIGSEVVPRGAWAATRVPSGARVEIVVAVGGG